MFAYDSLCANYTNFSFFLLFKRYEEYCRCQAFNIYILNQVGWIVIVAKTDNTTTLLSWVTTTTHLCFCGQFLHPWVFLSWAGLEAGRRKQRMNPWVHTILTLLQVNGLFSAIIYFKWEQEESTGLRDLKTLSWFSP